MSANGKGKAEVMAHDPLADIEVEAVEAETPPPAGEAPETVADDVAAADVIDLGDSLTIRDVGELHGRLCAALDLGGDLRIDAGALEQVDAAGIQLLCALARDARNQGFELQWQGVSDRLAAGVRQLGLEAELSV